MRLLRLGDWARPAPLRPARGCQGGRVPSSWQPQGLPSVGRRPWRERRPVRRGRVTNKKQKKGGWHLYGKGATHLLVLLAAIVAVGKAQPVFAQRVQTARILVIPFENAHHEQRLHWLSEASAVLMADELR